jgi:hypothetical protein
VSHWYLVYCFGVGVAFASGVGVGEACPFRASLRVARPFLRASTRVRRRVFFSGDGVGDALSVTAPFAGLGVGVGSAAKTLDCAIKPMAAARGRMCFIIMISGLSFKCGFFFSAEAWPTKALLRAYRPTTACLGNRVRALAASR